MSEQLFDHDGQRKYITEKERKAFLSAAENATEDIRTLCLVLAYTGCRISEALNLTVDRIDFSSRLIVFETLKKRRKGTYRGVPVPPGLLRDLDQVHQVRQRQTLVVGASSRRLWSLSRATAWRHIKSVMEAAGIRYGPQASPKGLRHGFGVAAVSRGIPLNMVQRWLGHAQLATTAIYANAVGAEEHKIAARMWT